MHLEVFKRSLSKQHGWIRHPSSCSPSITTIWHWFMDNSTLGLNCGIQYHTPKDPGGVLRIRVSGNEYTDLSLTCRPAVAHELALVLLAIMWDLLENSILDDHLWMRDPWPAHQWSNIYIILNVLQRAIRGGDCYLQCEDTNTKFQGTWEIKETGYNQKITKIFQ